MCKKRVIFSVALGIAVGLLLLLGVLYLITKSFALEAMLHIYIKLLLIPIVVRGIQKSFQNEIVEEKKTLVLCSIFLFVDLVVLDAVRFILSRGVFTILFLPSCLPLCFMILMHNAKETAGTEKNNLRKMAYWIGIPLLILSVYFEIISFI